MDVSLTGASRQDPEHLAVLSNLMGQGKHISLMCYKNKTFMQAIRGKKSEQTYIFTAFLPKTYWNEHTQK